MNKIAQILKESKIETPSLGNAEEDIEKIKYIRPEKLIMPTPEIMTQIFEKHVTEFEAVTEDKKKILIKVSVGDINGEPQTLTAYDREVFNGLCSIINAGYDFCTVRQIREAMTGSASMSPKSEENVTKSIEKMAAAIISVDGKEHAEEKMIRVEPGEAIVCGQKTHGYKILEKPVLLEYAEAVGQVLTVKKKYIQLPNVCNTEENITLKNYIIRKVSV